MKSSIVIPNFNSEKWIERLLNSIKSQTYKDYEVIIIDDMSEDNSPEILEKHKEDSDFPPLYYYKNSKKLWNGGSRNSGVESAVGEYIIFLDSDDFLDSDNCLQRISEIIEENNNPDCIRLPYRIFENGRKKEPIMLDDNTPEKLVNSCFVAPWTKCIKRELFAEFPENTLIEDVVQHIAQCDKLKTVAVCDIPITVWNRDNKDSCSLPENLHKYNSKRVSSVYRNIADLMDLQCEHYYCTSHRNWRLECYKNIVKEGKEEEIW